VVLSGGSTPLGLYSLLATSPALRTQVPWSSTHVFWGDERHVPPDHPDSNFRGADAALLSQVPIPASNVHRIRAELDAVSAAREYEAEIRGVFGLGGDELPRFDVLLLGMGNDGHTASLFPGTSALHADEHLVVANWVGKLDTERITLTASVLNNAACILVLVTGEDKAPAAKAVLHGAYEPEQLPAQLLAPTQGQLVWLLDRAAASRLDND
jgi:6-phosphogluconolactonase